MPPMTSPPLLHQRVCLEGLQARPELNGRRGVAVSYDEAEERYTVELDGSDSLRPRVKGTNLQRCAEPLAAEGVPAELKARFKKANANARSLPSEVFDQTMRLKLYALSKQSEGLSAPEAPPQGASDLETAKWTAWKCVRHLEQVEAITSYTEIIEKLVELVSSPDDSVPPPSVPEESPTAPPAPPAPPFKSPSTPHPGERGGGEVEDAVRSPGPTPMSESTKLEATAEPELEGGPELGPEPTVELTTWSTKGMVVPAGSTTTVPVLIPDQACAVTYSFIASSPDSLNSTAYLRVRIASPGTPSDGAAFVDVHQHRSEGRFEVAEKTGVLLAVLDNEAGWSPVTVAVKMDATPLAQMRALEAYRAHAKTRTELAAVETLVGDELALRASLDHTKRSLEEELQALRAQVLFVQERLGCTCAEGAASNERTVALQHKSSVLYMELTSLARM